MLEEQAAHVAPHYVAASAHLVRCALCCVAGMQALMKLRVMLKTRFGSLLALVAHVRTIVVQCPHNVGLGEAPGMLANGADVLQAVNTQRAFLDRSAVTVLQQGTH
jgi:hypothetical protein